MENSKKEIVLSGIRATGNLHLGNYFGALSKFVRMQNDDTHNYDPMFFIADLHALTTNPDPAQLHENVKNILAEYPLDELVMEKLDIKTDYFHSGTTFQNVFLRGDIGVYIGTSLNFGSHLVVGCRAQIGVKNTASTPNGVEHPYVRNVSFAGSVGYRF